MLILELSLIALSVALFVVLDLYTRGCEKI